MSRSNYWVNETPADPCVIAISPTAGRVLVAFGVVDTGNTSQTLSYTGAGTWTSLGNQGTSADGQVLGAAWKVADGTETSLSIQASSGSALIGGVIELDGRDGTVDFAVNITNNNTGQSSPWSITSGSVTPGNNGCDVVAIMGSDNTSAALGRVAHSFSTASGTTGAWTTLDVSNNAYRNLGVGVATQTTAGAITVTGTGTLASGVAGRALFVVGFRAAAGGSTETGAGSASGTGTASGVGAATAAATASSAGAGAAAGIGAAVAAAAAASSAAASVSGAGAAVIAAVASTAGAATVAATGAATFSATGSAAGTVSVVSVGAATAASVGAAAGTSTVLGYTPGSTIEARAINTRTGAPRTRTIDAAKRRIHVGRPRDRIRESL